MYNVMKYQNYLARIEFEPYGEIFVGKIMAIEKEVVFEGKSVETLKKAFAKAVEKYLDDCFEQGAMPDNPYSGDFHITLSQEVHRMIAIASAYKNISLSDFVLHSIDYTLTNSRDGFRKLFE